MISLVKAELYKTIKKSSFKFILLLIIFVSIFSLIVINKNVNLKSEQVITYPLYSKNEYKNVNKYGNYKHYLRNYENYVEVVNRENEIILKNSNSNAKYLLSYSHNFIFLLGVIVIIISYQSFSIDYNSDSLKYVYMSKRGRKNIFISRLIANAVIFIFLLTFLIIIMCITTLLLTKENIFTIKDYINIGNSYKEVFFIFKFLKYSFVYVVPFFFISTLSFFISILFKGSSFALVLSEVIYFTSLTFSQILFKYGFNFIKYTFFPYIDFTFLKDPVEISLNNLIYNLNFSYSNSILLLLFSSIIFIIISLKLLKRDV